MFCKNPYRFNAFNSLSFIIKAMKKAVYLHRLGARIKYLERPFATSEESFDIFHFFDDVRGEDLASFFGDV